MTTAAPTSTLAPSLESVTKTVSTRLSSIDIFRGITMAMMIFVNDLASVHGLPWWNYHARTQMDFMTYPDFVFPFFLFIIGLSLPLSIKARLKKNPSTGSLWLHVLTRSISLVVLGMILANGERGDAALMHMNANLWSLLGLFGMSLYLSVYPTKTSRGETIHRVLKIVGVVLVVVLYVIYRRTFRDGHVGWINISGYPEILGLIGYTYFCVSLLYIPTRKWLLAPLGWLVAGAAFNSLIHARIIQLPQHVPLYEWPFGGGELVFITFGGIVASTIFTGDHKWQSIKQKISLGLGYAVIACAAGWLLSPLGISKNRGTPTWGLWSIALAAACFTLLYWLCDVKKKTGWAWLFQPAGANTLLTYLLPDYFYFLIPLLGITFLNTHFVTGFPGIARAVIFTVVMLLLARVFTNQWKVRLAL